MDGTGGAEGYQPGVCNIGTPERQRRRRFGHLGTAAGVFVLAVVAVLPVPPYYALASTVFFIGGASGYLQDRYRFCVYYARRGEFNLGPLDTTPEAVTEAAAKQRDQERARKINLYSLVLGLAAGLLGTAVLYSI